MAFKFIVFAAFITVAKAGVINSPSAYTHTDPVAYSAPINHNAPVANAAPIAPASYGPSVGAYSAPIPWAVTRRPYVPPPPQYSYGSNLQDALTGDSKNKGRYTIVDADGNESTVYYTANPVQGVHNFGTKEPLATPVVAKVAAPGVTKVAYDALGSKVTSYVPSEAAHTASVTYSAHHIAAPVAYSAHHVAAPVAVAHPDQGAQAYYPY